MHPDRWTILIIDDSPEDRETYCRYLLRDPQHTYQILQADSGEVGLELFQHHQPDVTLLDFVMPDLNGLEVLRELRSLTGKTGLPVVMLTGQGNEHVAVAAMKGGAVDYLLKGELTALSLQHTVRSVIEREHLKQRRKQAEAALSRQLRQEQLITRIAQRIRQSLDLKTILQQTVDEVRQFLQTDRVIIFQLQLTGTGTVLTESVGAGWKSILLSTIHDPCFVDTWIDRYQQGLVTTKSDIQDGSLDACYVKLLEQFQVCANLVVPILQEDHLWGLIIAHHCAAPRQWDSLEINLLQQLATQISIAIQHSDVYQRYATLAEHAPVGIFRTDAQGHCLYVNDRWSRLTGLTLAQAFQDGWAQTLHPDDHDRVCSE